jgi:hypothetical protein
MADPIWSATGWVTDEMVDFYTAGCYVKQPHPEPNNTGVTVFEAMANPPKPIEES